MFLPPAASVPVASPTVRPAAVIVGALAGGTAAERRHVVVVRPGGLVLFHELADGGRTLRAQLRRAGARPVLMVDQEGGDVRRVPSLGPAAAPALGRGTRTATRVAFRVVGHGLRVLGVDVDLAPVADVARGGATAGRSFGPTPARVARHVTAAIIGLRRGGVAGCLKHFPGLGAVPVSTDDGVGLDARPRRAVLADLEAFRPAIRAGARCVMVSSVVVPALCARPALLCPQVYARLRHMGFRGVVVTDSLDAAALHAYGTPAVLAVAALRAGADAAMTTRARSTLAAIGAVGAAMRDGELARARIVAGAARLAALR